MPPIEYVQPPRPVRFGTGKSALELRISYIVGTNARHIQQRRVRGRPLPTLPLDSGSRPITGIEVRRDSEVLYRRALPPPGFVETGAASPAWVRLPVGHRQQLVVLVPDLPGAVVVAFSDGDLWLRVGKG